MRIVKGLALAGMILMLALSARGIAVAQTPSPLYFPETRYSIQGEFLAYWRTVPDPLVLFGYPISDEFLDSVTGLPTQYFQRARFDLVMTPTGPEVRLADLGSLLYDDLGAPANIPEDGATCHPFPKTGHNVCYAFYQFYDANQGTRFFGNPISGLEIREGVITQYFEKARMEWHANRPSGQRVVLGFLGRLACDKYCPINPTNAPLYEPGIPSRPAEVTSLTVHAFARQALIPAGGQQVLYVIVQDQNVAAVPGVQATINIIYPDGRAFPVKPMDLTGADGVVKVSFPVAQFPPNSLVQITVEVETQGLKARTISSFRIWY